ncbi:MAG: SIMPL domain-containing protein, partial [Candidatus Nanopelagicales bacterium]
VRLHSVRLQIGDEDALLDEARAAAIDDARAKAEQYAAAAGSELGEVSSIREVHITPNVERSYGLADAAAAVGSVPIRAGTADINVTVSVVWSLA